MGNRYEEIAKVFRALCDPNRVRIIEILQGGERCACILLRDLNIVQSTLSHHMKILCESGFVDAYRDGRWMYYSLNQENFERAKRILDKISMNNYRNNT